MTTTELLPLILLGGGAFLLIGAAVHFTGVGSLNNIKSKTVGDGQHGTARWATKQEIQKTYRHIPPEHCPTGRSEIKVSMTNISYRAAIPLLLTGNCLTGHRHC